MSRDYVLKVRLDDEERKALDDAAEQLKEPVSMIVRRALRQYVDQLTPQPKGKR